MDGADTGSEGKGLAIVGRKAEIEDGEGKGKSLNMSSAAVSVCLVNNLSHLPGCGIRLRVERIVGLTRRYLKAHLAPNSDDLGYPFIWHWALDTSIDSQTE